MRVGVTGHQKRPNIDWLWVRGQVRLLLAQATPPLTCYSSLAAGADQLFAEETLLAGGELVAVVPFPGYQRTLDGSSLENYRRLLNSSRVVELPWRDSDAACFHVAGQYVVDHSELLVAIWDGRPAEGLGGTADIVAYAMNVKRPITHLDTTSNVVRHPQ